MTTTSIGHEVDFTIKEYETWTQDRLINDLGLGLAFENIIDNVYGANNRNSITDIRTRFVSDKPVQPPLNGRVTVTVMFDNIKVTQQGNLTGVFDSFKMQTNFVDNAVKGLFVITPINWSAVNNKKLWLYYSQNLTDSLLATVLFYTNSLVIVMEDIKQQTKSQYELSFTSPTSSDPTSSESKDGFATIQDVYKRYPLFNPFLANANKHMVLTDKLTFLTDVCNNRLHPDFTLNTVYNISYSTSSVTILKFGRKIARLIWKQNSNSQRLLYTLIEFNSSGNNTHESTFYSTYEPIDAYKQYVKLV